MNLVRVALFAVAALIPVGLGACGNTRRGVGSRSSGSSQSRTATASYQIGDGDGTYDDSGGDSGEDRRQRSWGREAAPAQRHAVAKLVRRYYGAALAGDGAAVCGLLAPAFAHGNAARGAVPPEYVALMDPSDLRGRRCAQIATRVLAASRVQLQAEGDSPLVSDVRVLGRRALALLAFRTMPERLLRAVHERGWWRLVQVLDSEIL